MGLSKTHKSTSALCFLYCVTFTLPLAEEHTRPFTATVASRDGSTWRYPQTKYARAWNDGGAAYGHARHTHNHSQLMSLGSGAFRDSSTFLKSFFPPNMLQSALFAGLILRHSGCFKHNDDLQWTDPDNWNPDSQIPRWHREIPSEPTTQKCKDIYNHKEKKEIKTNWSRQRFVVLACTDYPDPNVLCILLCAPKPSTLEKRKLQSSNIALVMSGDSRRKRNGEKASKMQQ